MRKPIRKRQGTRRGLAGAGGHAVTRGRMSFFLLKTHRAAQSPSSAAALWAAARVATREAEDAMRLAERCAEEARVLAQKAAAAEARLKAMALPQQHGCARYGSRDTEVPERTEVGGASTT